jgi:class 3 adenylate cyclase/predicted ATPase
VLVCNLADSMALLATLDPDSLREVLGAYHTACRGIVERLGGVVARQVGDALSAQYDNAARAARAGLAIVAALPELNNRLAQHLPTLRSAPLRVRIGIAVARRLVGASADREGGDAHHTASSLAARLQRLGDPDAVIVSGGIYERLGVAFRAEFLGSQQIEGAPAPIEAYRLHGERAVAPERHAMPWAGQTPLVGRKEELGVLLDRWHRSVDGLGQVVYLSGDAGIGKTRLVQELKARVADLPCLTVEGRGSPYHRLSAYYPIMDLLQQAFGFDHGDSAATKWGKVVEALGEGDPLFLETLPFLASLLRLPSERADAEALGLTPQEHRERTLSALLMVVRRVAGHQPVLMIIEDLQWADPSTLELLDLLVDETLTARLFLVLTARPELRSPWDSRANVTRLTLPRLRRAQVERLPAALSGGKAIPAEVVDRMAWQSDGVPLFVEEIFKMMLSSELLREGSAGYELAAPLASLALPVTLQSTLMSRLDRLDTTKVVAQLAAALGQAFPFELLRAVADLDEVTLTHELGKLVAAQLLRQSGSPPRATYAFRHALIHDATYRGLQKSTRLQYHQRIAQVLEAQFPDTAEFHPELLAHHYTEAGLGGRALGYWQRAGQRALERSANREAIAHLGQALDLLTTLPQSPERLAHEIELLTVLGPAMILTHGYAAPEVEQAYTRARELCRQVGDSPQAFPLLSRLWRFHQGRAEHEQARDAAEQMVAIARHADDTGLLREAHGALGQVLYLRGELPAARAHLEEAIALSDPEEGELPAARFSHGAAIAARACAALVLWLLGYPDEALRRSQEALSRAQSARHANSSASALIGVVGIHQHRREPRQAEPHVEALRELGAAHAMASTVGIAAMWGGWVLAELGQADEGVPRLTEGLIAFEATAIRVCRPYWLALLAEAHDKLGHPTAGLRALTEAIDTSQSTGERWWEAEICRLKGELLLGQAAGKEVAGIASDAAGTAVTDLKGSVLSAAEGWFLQALELAREQQAKSLELRAAMGLSRLWQRQGRHEAARRTLAAIYERFTEGFDTPDLRDAHALLEELTP